MEDLDGPEYDGIEEEEPVNFYADASLTKDGPAAKEEKRVPAISPFKPSAWTWNPDAETYTIPC